MKQHRLALEWYWLLEYEAFIAAIAVANYLFVVIADSAPWIKYACVFGEGLSTRAFSV
jgi:hypothetical protein